MFMYVSFHLCMVWLCRFDLKKDLFTKRVLKYVFMTEFDCPCVTHCGWQDVKIQFLTNFPVFLLLVSNHPFLHYPYFFFFSFIHYSPFSFIFCLFPPFFLPVRGFSTVGIKHPLTQLDITMSFHSRQLVFCQCSRPCIWRSVQVCMH